MPDLHHANVGSRYDRIVIGLGGVGSATAAHLAANGCSVLGIEQFSLLHDRGSSHGETRIIRKAYFEHPSYVPLLHRAYELWEELSLSTGRSLFNQVGLIEVGPADGQLISGIERSADAHGLQIERPSRHEFTGRFPMFNLPQGMLAVVEPTAGILHVEACVAAHLHVARSYAAQIMEHTRVVKIEPMPDTIRVITNRGDFVCEGIVIAGGAWTTQLLSCDLSIALQRKHVHWFSVAHTGLAEAGVPPFFYELPQGYFYGFPSLDGYRFKIAEHSGGESITDPTEMSREPNPEDSRRVAESLTHILRNPTCEPLDHGVCLYSMSSDQHFIIDHHPNDRRIVFAAGLSGHGFKFTPVLGEILAELSLTWQTRWPIEFLRRRPK